MKREPFTYPLTHDELEAVFLAAMLDSSEDNEYDDEYDNYEDDEYDDYEED